MSGYCSFTRLYKYLLTFNPTSTFTFTTPSLPFSPLPPPPLLYCFQIQSLHLQSNLNHATQANLVRGC